MPRLLRSQNSGKHSKSTDSRSRWPRQSLRDSLHDMPPTRAGGAEVLRMFVTAYLLSSRYFDGRFVGDDAERKNGFAKSDGGRGRSRMRG